MVSKRTLGVLSVCACFCAALGASVQFKSFSAQGPGICENPCVDGVAKVKFRANQGQTRFHLNISDLLPNTTYGVLVENQDNLTGFANGTAFTTNNHGHGNFQHDFLGDATTTDNVLVVIFRWDGDVDSLFTVTPLEVRAVAVIDDGCDD